MTAASSQDSTTNRINDSPFLALPAELKIQVVRILDISDVASLRRISRDWADVGAPELFKDGFSLRPHRDDMTRLQSVCNHPDIAKGIRHLDIYIGSIDEQQFWHAVAKQDRLLSENDIKALQKLCLKLFPNTTSMHCDKANLEKFFSLLPNLTSIDATSSRFPFSTLLDPATRKSPRPKMVEILHRVWDNLEEDFDRYHRTNFYDNVVSCTRYSNMLLATLKLNTPIEKLFLDSFPIECFVHAPVVVDDSYTGTPLPDPSSVSTIDETKVQELAKAVTGVRDLRISPIGSGSADDFYSDIHLARTIGKFIGSMQQLRSLQIEWLVEEASSDEFLEAWERSLYKNYFPHLEDLRLMKMDSLEKKVSPFILRHASTLKRLHLGTETMWIDWDLDMELDQNEEKRTWRDLFTEYREGLPNLQIFEYLEDTTDPQRIYDDDWNSFPIAKNKRVPNAKLLELYVLKKCPWPMSNDNPRGWRGWKPKFMGSHLDFMNLSPEQLDELLGGDWETESDSSSSDDEDMDLDDDSDDFDSDGEGYNEDDDSDMGGMWFDI